MLIKYKINRVYTYDLYIFVNVSGLETFILNSPTNRMLDVTVQ